MTNPLRLFIGYSVLTYLWLKLIGISIAFIAIVYGAGVLTIGLAHNKLHSNDRLSAYALLPLLFLFYIIGSIVFYKRIHCLDFKGKYYLTVFVIGIITYISVVAVPGFFVPDSYR